MQMTTHKKKKLTTLKTVQEWLPCKSDPKSLKDVASFPKNQVDAVHKRSPNVPQPSSLIQDDKK